MTPVALGTCSITVSVVGNANYLPASITPSFTSRRAWQTISFSSLSNVAYGSSPFAIGATASSGLAVTFASTTPPICTVSGTTVTIVAVGTCSITASQSGNANYAAATPVTHSFTVGTTAQTITFGPLSNQVFGAAPFQLSATASSGLPVSFSSTTSGVCTVSGSTVTILAAGTCSITATQAGNANYSAANPVIQAFTVSPAPQTITFQALSSVTLGTSPLALSASGPRHSVTIHDRLQAA